MQKCYVENLEMIITDRCNLDCAHCLRGKKCNRDMSDEVVESTLSQIRSICNLAINGGEHTLIKRPAKFKKEAYKEYKRYQTYNK